MAMMTFGLAAPSSQTVSQSQEYDARIVALTSNDNNDIALNISLSTTGNLLEFSDSFMEMVETRDRWEN
jgi:hypothetical protein